MQTIAHNDVKQRLRINKRARDQLGGLTVMFLLGMSVTLIGLPSEAAGMAKTATTILLGLHILVGTGLVAGSILTLLRARSSGFLKPAWIGLTAVALTFLCGVMTAATESNWWSYAMAVGFIANFWIYGALFVKTRIEK
jgi:hypothetical protein